jgi:hypothetical protein
MKISGLRKRKANIFLVFLVCSFLIWLVSRLSETYTQSTSFELVYTNLPDSLKLTYISKDHVDVRLRASGFQFLGFNFRTKKIYIDLSTVQQSESRYFIPQNIYRKQIQDQLAGSMTLLEADRDTLFFDFYTLYEKEVPVRPNIKIDLGQNYLMDGEIEISPKNIIIKGPKKEIAEVDSVSTLKMELSDLNSDFETTAALNKPAGLVNTTYSTNSVRVSGKVFRFSEKIIDVPVEVINLPEGTAIRTFPNAVSVLCKARMDILKNLGVADFKVVGDFNTAKRKNQNITVELKERPENLQSAQLLENEVEYILKRE